LKEQYLEKEQWEDNDCSTYSNSTETQQLTVIERWKVWLVTVADGKLPAKQMIEG
jgi:hypothetical protein